MEVRALPNTNSPTPTPPVARPTKPATCPLVLGAWLEALKTCGGTMKGLSSMSLASGCGQVSFRQSGSRYADFRIRNGHLHFVWYFPAFNKQVFNELGAAGIIQRGSYGTRIIDYGKCPAVL